MKHTMTITNGGMVPNDYAKDSLAYAILMNYNPRHVPTLIGPVYITATHVIIDQHTNDEYDDTPPLMAWWNKELGMCDLDVLLLTRDLT